MQTLILIVHFLICSALILLVLVQQGKANAGGIMGGASNTMFGSIGAAPFMVKLTAGLALLFFISSFSLSYLVKQSHTHIVVTEAIHGPHGKPK